MIVKYYTLNLYFILHTFGQTTYIFSALKKVAAFDGILT